MDRTVKALIPTGMFLVEYNGPLAAPAGGSLAENS
jgi:hypothetical protein